MPLSTAKRMLVTGALSQGVGLTDAFVLRDENDTKALVDLDFENSRFYFNGTLTRSKAAIMALMGGTDNGDGTYTLGPVSNAPFAGYNAPAGTVISEWTSTSETLGLFVYTIQAASNANYMRRLTLNGTSQSEFAVNSGSASQANIQSGASAERQTNYRFRAVDVMAANDFTEHVNGELIGSDTSGVVSAAATSVSAQLGHRAGSNKLIGSLHRWTYFPRAISSARRRYLSFLQPEDSVIAGAWTFFNDPRAIVINGGIYVGGVEPQSGRFVVGKVGGLTS